MTPERWARLKELFTAAAEAGDAERQRLLAALREQDPELAAELEGLLGADVGDEETTADADWLARAARSVPPDAPARIDRYAILGVLGQGGMGRVFLAERADGAYRQRVALKVLSGGRLASPEGRQRFVAERQILARLTHPAIARLIDGGATADGEPFLATEHVDGRPIDVYCREEGLGAEAVVRLFLEVCAAVEAAHRSLVVHRDLKPSNVLVTADGRPKLLDFGIAKLLDPAAGDPAAGETAAGEAAFETRLGHAPLTPRYASPEQVRGEPVTVATDVYSLGVVLYELLTGVSPYGEASGSPASLARAICEQEPRPPSTVTATRPEIAGRRPAFPRRKLARDLDAVVLRALHKDPERRYGSAEQLSADLRRFLERLPVIARSPTLAYRATRLVARHRLAALAAAAAVAGLALFVVQRERQLAATQRERDKAEAVLALLVETIGQADPARAQGDSLTVRETLEHSADQARVRLRDHPLAEATLLDAVGTVYAKLGLYEQAEAPLRRALELRRAHYPRGDPEVARSEMHFGELSLHRGDYETARRYLEGALAAFRRDGEHPAEVAALLLDLARLESDQGDPKRAERLAREALALQQDALGEKDVQFASTLDQLGSLAYLRGDYASAEDLLRQGLEVRRLALGESHPATLDSLSNLAHVLDARGAAEESTRLLREVLAARRRVLGEGHPEVAAALNNLGSTLSGEGRFAEAEPLLQEAVRIAAAALAPSNVAHATYLGNLAQAVQGQGRAPDATALYRRALEATEAVHGREHPDAALALHNLASALDDEGDSPGAEALYWEALAIYDRTLPPDHLHPTFTRLKLARIAIRRGDAAAAEPLLREALKVRQAVLDAGNWRTAAVEVALGQVLALAGRRPDAEALTEQAWQRMAAELGADNHYAREAAADVAGTWQRLGWTEPAGRWRRRADGSPDPD